MNEKKRAAAYRLLVLALLCWMAIYMLCFSKSAAAATAKGLSVAVNTVVPSVFPYFVISGVFVQTGLSQQFGQKMRWMTDRLALPGCCAGAIILGIVCGFPVGAQMANSLYQKGDIDSEQAARLAAFTNFCGPAYMIGVLGQKIFGSAKVGMLIFFVQTCLAMISGLCLAIGKKCCTGAAVNAKYNAFSSAFTEAVTGAAKSTLHICAYITFFSVFVSSFVPLLQRLSSQIQALVYGFFEMSGGIEALQGLENNLIFAVWIVMWSGVSVFMQVICALKQSGAKISVLPYLAVRAVCMPIGGLLVYIICRILHFT